MSYINPGEVISPKAHWHLFDVILDRREGDCAYALGTWDGERRIGFRWNGSSQTGSLGNPQSRGLPTWTILDPALHPAVVALLPPEKQALAKRFLGLRTPSEWESIICRASDLHSDRCDEVCSSSALVELLYKSVLVLHVVPFSAVDTRHPVSSDEIFKRPEKFPPIGRARPADSKIDATGLIVGSNEEGLRKPQRAYVHVSRSGVVEAVAALHLKGHDSNFLDLSVISDQVVKYSQIYTASLNSCGVVPPVVILASVLGVNGARLIKEVMIGAHLEDLPRTELVVDKLHFEGVVFETVPADANESAKILRPLLSHMANAANLPTSPFFDADGNYNLKIRQSP